MPDLPERVELLDLAAEHPSLASLGRSLGFTHRQTFSEALRRAGLYQEAFHAVYLDGFRSLRTRRTV